MDERYITQDQDAFSAKDIDVLQAVNILRDDTGNTINSYVNYKILWLCLDHYIKNKTLFCRLIPKGLNLNPAKLMNIIA